MGNSVPCPNRVRILLLGLNDAGKTTILYKLKYGQVVETITTIELVRYKKSKFEILDFGGHKRIRWLWYRFCHEVQAVIFVIDANDRLRIPEVKELLGRLLVINDLRHVCLLFYANIRVAENAMTVEEIITELGLHNLGDMEWRVASIRAADSRTDDLYEGFDWLWRTLIRRKPKMVKG